MSRRQTTLGKDYEAPSIPELDEAAEEWRDARKTSKAAKAKENEKKFAVIALMGANKLAKYKYTEQESGEEILLSIDSEPKVKAKKTGEAEPEPIGDGVASGGDDAPGIHPGLIAQAEKAMADNGVVENDDGDVVAPDKAAPRSKSKRRAGGKAKRKGR